MRYAYPYRAKPEPGGGFFVSFADVPEALTGAELEAEVPRMAQEALVAALSFYTEAGRPLPAPSSTPGRKLAVVPVRVALKLALHETMLGTGTSNVALARLLGIDEKAVRRMRDLLQTTKVEKLEAALDALGRHAEITVVERAA